MKALLLIIYSFFPFHRIGEIPLPTGYKRLPASGFSNWLRQIPLKSDKTVYLYNGQPKRNQLAQYAVLDISRGDKDLQQCADAVIRLYAEYYYSSGQFSRIAFHATDGTLMDYVSYTKGYRFVAKGNQLQKQLIAKPGDSPALFHAYLESLFSYAGTLSLSRELSPVTDSRSLKPGDIFIHGGSPGHAVIVADVAVNPAGEKIFLLAQSYMPAQDIHVLQNPLGASSPWYTVKASGPLLTPEWYFDWSELKRFAD
jgi:hypothetical protein